MSRNRFGTWHLGLLCPVDVSPPDLAFLPTGHGDHHTALKKRSHASAAASTSSDTARPFVGGIYITCPCDGPSQGVCGEAITLCRNARGMTLNASWKSLVVVCQHSSATAHQRIAMYLESMLLCDHVDGSEDLACFGTVGSTCG